MYGYKHTHACTHTCTHARTHARTQLEQAHTRAHTHTHINARARARSLGHTHTYKCGETVAEHTAFSLSSCRWLTGQKQKSDYKLTFSPNVKPTSEGTLTNSKKNHEHARLTCSNNQGRNSNCLCLQRTNTYILDCCMMKALIWIWLRQYQEWFGQQPRK